MSDQPLSAGTETRAAVEAGLIAAKPYGVGVTTDTPDEEPYVYANVLPYGAEQVVFNPEKYEAVPRRRRGTVWAQTVTSLLDYVKRHRDEATTVWVDLEQKAITGVINDHGMRAEGADAGWGDHRAIMQLATTPEWQHWAGKDGALVSQEAFAEHIEDGVMEIVTPPAADMLEIAQTFQAHTDAQFRQATRLQSGQVQFRYDEETTARAGTNGQLDVPSSFTLGISPFLGEDPYEVTARLRYRVKGGSLLIGYKLDRPEMVLRDAMQTIATRIAAEHPATFIGTPRADNDA